MANQYGYALGIKTVENTVKILRVARAMKSKPPIVFTIQSYNPDLTDVSPVLVRKTPFLEELVEGSKWVKLDPVLKLSASWMSLAL